MIVNLSREYQFLYNIVTDNKMKFFQYFHTARLDPGYEFNMLCHASNSLRDNVLKNVDNLLAGLLMRISTVNKFTDYSKFGEQLCW